MADAVLQQLATACFCWSRIPATIEPLKPASYLRAWPLLVIFACAEIAAGCAASFGPGYTVDKQEMDVHFEPGASPHISIKSNYQLKNTGTRPISMLELRLPGRRRFTSTNVDHTSGTENLSSRHNLPKTRERRC